MELLLLPYLTENLSLQGACGIILPIIKAEGVRQMFFPAAVPAYYRAPPAWTKNCCWWSDHDLMATDVSRMEFFLCSWSFVVVSWLVVRAETNLYSVWPWPLGTLKCVGFVLYACQIPAKLYRILLNKWMRRIVSRRSKLGCSLRAEH